MEGSNRVAPRLGAILVLSLWTSGVLAAQGRSAQASLVGTWRLAEHWNKDSVGSVFHQFGPTPIGLFVHDATGHFSVQIMRTPAAHAVPASTDTAAIRKFIEGYYASFGTFTVDRAKGESVYHVEGSTVPRLIGTDAPLPFRLSGDSLIIGDGSTWRRVWLRVR